MSEAAINPLRPQDEQALLHFVRHIADIRKSANMEERTQVSE
jgi:hypothetical protein